MEDGEKYVTKVECGLIDKRVSDAIKHLEEKAEIVIGNIDDRVSVVEQKTEDIHKLTLAVSDLAHNMATMLKNQDSTDTRVKVLEARDGEKWRKVVEYAMFTILGALIMFVMKQIGIA